MSTSGEIVENDVSIAIMRTLLYSYVKIFTDGYRDFARAMGIEDEISKRMISLYDETSNSDRMSDKQFAGKCLDLWDIMFERQFGAVREVSGNGWSGKRGMRGGE